MDILTNDEILEAIKEKYPCEDYVTQLIGFDNIKSHKLSFAQVPPNIRIDIFNEPTEKDYATNSITFKIKDIQQAVAVMDRYFNITGTFKDFVDEYNRIEHVDLSKDLYMCFFLLSTE